MEPIHLRGFTLVEMLVVLAIIASITGIALTSQGSFNKTLVVSNTAYDIALTLRAAETYGIGSRAAGSDSNAGYGLNFNRSTPSDITLFSDTYPAPAMDSQCHPIHPPSDASSPNAKPGNCTYDEIEGERVTTYTIGNGITVSDFCVRIGGTPYCAHAQGGTLSSLDIVFTRPNPEPSITINRVFSQDAAISSACLVVSSPQGGRRYVSVLSSGQITANAVSCP